MLWVSTKNELRGTNLTVFSLPDTKLADFRRNLADFSKELMDFLCFSMETLPKPAKSAVRVSKHGGKIKFSPWKINIFDVIFLRVRLAKGVSIWWVSVPST